ncbi:porin family protein [Congregibacter litoralis]|uniref:Opacity protein n=1 Tax=Congregibacter litoralis KT71 TaxID=314285 RepID=A4A513_9GAMM|nr:porin family protein [Congregibacter litoralis]EAQ98884.1 Opacity protein [Congregibacter litoralis KT71]
MRTAQLLIVALALFSLTAQAQFAGPMVQRSGKWETTIGLYLTGSESSDGLNESSVDIDSGYGIGFSAGYNFTQNLALRFDGSWSRADYDAVLDTEDEGLVFINHRLTTFTGQFNGVWNLLDGPFTPYVQAGIGWTYLDSNVADGPPSTGCWWDPWWGYICSNFYSTYAETNFSWNIGAGLRYEFGRGMFVRGGWEQTTIDGGQGADPTFDAFRAELGWQF